MADRTSDVEIGEVVFVKSLQEKGPVIDIRPTSITVRLMTKEVIVPEGDFEKR